MIFEDDYSMHFLQLLHTSIVPALHAGIIHNDKSNGNFMHHYQLSM